MAEQYGERPRSIRVDDALWAAMTEAASSNGESVSEAVRRFMRSYVKRARRAS